MLIVDVNEDLYLLIKVPSYYVVVKLNALDAAKLGQNRQNLFLLLGREHNLAVMRPIIWSISATE